MVQSVELLLDEASEHAVLRQWEALDDAGLPSQAQHRGASNRPHVTLDARDRLEDAGEAALAAVARALPLDVVVGPLTVFGDPGRRSGLVLVRLVVADEPLLALHRDVQEALGPGGSPTTATGRLVPHVTLARRMRPDDVARALEVLAGAADLPGRLTRLRRWDGDQRRDWLVGA